ncbi:MAG TPA: transaldolase [Steroidobacteraceae bacterium]|nr:transaldolase [Steroidobacteraceae bacterium]
MNPITSRARELGQSLWLDNITRELLDSGTLARYIDDLSITGVTSNPTTFDEALTNSAAYDREILAAAAQGKSDESLFIELALEDLRRAADLLRPVFDATQGTDGWVSMEVSPSLADDTHGTLDAARRIFDGAARPNLFVKIPGTPAGVAAIEESIFAGIPVNVTLLFSREQYLAAAQAYLRGIERRLEAGRPAQVASVASVFVSRWDKAVSSSVPADLRSQLGIAIAGRTYRANLDLLDSARWRTLATQGARPQRLLWASTGPKDPDSPDTLYVDALAAPGTINTLPEKTLAAFADHGNPRLMAMDGVAAEAALTRFAKAGVDVDSLASQLQREGAQSFLKSWQHLMRGIASKRAAS